jgi:hypothetical protein
MTDIDFNEPSTGNVSTGGVNRTALKINYTASIGSGIIVESSDANAVTGNATAPANSPKTWTGVKGKGHIGVIGDSTRGGGSGVVGQGTNGVVGTAVLIGGVPAVSGVKGVNTDGKGVYGTSIKGIGVYGESFGTDKSGVKGEGFKGEHNAVRVTGVMGVSDNWFGVLGQSKASDGVRGEVAIKTGSGVAGINKGEGPGVYGQGIIAGRFVGDVEVTGDIKLLNPQSADFAEDFDILEENVEPGTVMVLTEKGSLQSSYQEYDKKVAGIISGAGGYSPAITLGKEEESDRKNRNKSRLPVALMGKVYCKVDARGSPIETGDLLTTSFTKGYAMKAEDPVKAFGAVIGKALGSIKEGLGMIPVLVTLQ